MSCVPSLHIRTKIPSLGSFLFFPSFSALFLFSIFPLDKHQIYLTSDTDPNLPLFPDFTFSYSSLIHKLKYPVWKNHKDRFFKLNLASFVCFLLMSTAQAPTQFSSQVVQQEQSQQSLNLKRPLSFSTKPPFQTPGGDYHHFGLPEPQHRASGQEDQGIVVKSPVSLIFSFPCVLLCFLA